MLEHMFVDGPLAGQTALMEGLSPGDSVLVEIVDYGDDDATPQRYEYVTASPPSQDSEQRRLRFTGRASENSVPASTQPGPDLMLDP